jgi:S-sulfo-L-cysteine synthase (O-acetyl-L-serine-dependent)
MQALRTLEISGNLSERVASLEGQIGHTPLHRVSRLFSKKNVTVYAKKEWMQLSGSVKARAAYAIFRAAVESGQLKEGRTLLDATSGNTGIAYASIGKLLNIPVTLCIPENASRERKDILRSLGAELVFTSRFDNTDGSQLRAKSLAAQYPEKYFYADQYKNDNNWKAHYHTTAPEIFEALPGITHFVAGLGTTGTFMGTARRLRKLNPAIQSVSLQPQSALHGLEGWKHLETAIVPAFYDAGLADENMEIATEDAYALIREAKEKEGLILSPSSAANLVGAIRVASSLEKGVVVTVLPDNGDKYGDLFKNIF